MKIVISTLALLLVSQTLWAQSAAELVQRDVSKVVKTFSRETRLYHYFNMPTVTGANGAKTIDAWLMNDDNRAKWINDLFSSRAGAFWDLNNHNTFKVNAGPGMYMALEPNSSRSYGDTMVTLDVPRGSNYISTVSTISLKSDTLSALVKEGVVTTSQLKESENTLGLEKGLTAAALKNMVLTENQNFRILVQGVFQNLNIKFIEYGYKAHQNGFCKGGRLTAIIFLGSKPADQTSSGVMAIVDAEYRKQGLAADYLRGVFAEPTNTFVELMVRYRDTIAQIRESAFDAPKVVNWPKAHAIISQNLSTEEVAHLRDISFECKTP